MKRFVWSFAVLLAAALISSCSPAEPADPADGSTPAAEQTAAPENAASENAAPLEEDAFDVPASMDEVRQRTIEYFNAMSAVKWIAPETMDYTASSKWTTHLVYEKGQTYYGIPYTSSRHPAASLEEFQSYLNADGLYTGPTDFKNLVGGDCGSMRRAWAYSGALCGYGMQYADFEMFPKESLRRGLPVVTEKVGEYDDSAFTHDTATYDSIMTVNGEETMYEAMALLKACDLIGSRFQLNGIIAQHVRMLVEDASVVRLGNGKIAPSKSYITYSEQTSYVRTIDGKKTTWKLNVKETFQQLFKDGYVPMTIASLKNETVTPPDMTASGFSKPENFASSPVLKGTVKCNYNILTLTAEITDAQGNVVSSFVGYPYALTAILSDYPLSTPVRDLPAGTYRFKAVAAIGFGEKTVAEFDFTK